MKRGLTYYFRKLSLTQQVLLLILVMLLLLSLFFTFFLSTNIDYTIQNQMYEMMQNNQKPLVNALDDNSDEKLTSELFYYLASDTVQTTCIINKDQVLYLSDTHDPVPEQAFFTVVKEEAAKLLDSPKKAKEATWQGPNHLYYYRLEKVSVDHNPMVLLSFMSDNYANKFRNSLVDSTVYVTVLVFGMILLILMVWVFSIIRPLNQLKGYIAQIKQGKDVQLNLNRDDEIGELAKELSAMQEELQKQEKAKEEMIHNISHDLKTPIATIKSYSESIKDGIYPYGTLEKSVDVILNNAQRLEDKVHNMLYLNRIEYLVTSDAEGVVTNMKEVVEQVVLNSAVIRPEIRIETDVEEVFFDGLLESWRVCIENIMENAFRYAKSYIKIVVKDDDLRIYNDGRKMQEDRIDALFKPYVMGEEGKFGLGLSIVSKVAKVNRYKVEGFNTDDGVCFRIYRDKPKNSQRREKDKNAFRRKKN